MQKYIHIYIYIYIFVATFYYAVAAAQLNSALTMIVILQYRIERRLLLLAERSGRKKR